MFYPVKFVNSIDPTPDLLQALHQMTQQQRKTTWKQDPEAVREDILRVAIREFGEHGLSGARIDEIARKTTTSKRMIYYYFVDKEGLYQHALQREYDRLRDDRSALRLDSLPPVEALRCLTEFMFDWHRNNPDFVRLVVIENALEARHLKQSENTDLRAAAVTGPLSALLNRGAKDGVFRAGLDPVVVHMTMTATSFYNTSNRYTFPLIFGEDVRSDKTQGALRDALVQMIFGLVLTPEAFGREMP